MYCLLLEPYNQARCLSSNVPKNKQFLQELITYPEHRRSPSVLSGLFCLCVCLFVCLFGFFFLLFLRVFFAIEFAVLRFTAFVLYNGCNFSKHRIKYLQYNGHSCKIIRKKSIKY